MWQLSPWKKYHETSFRLAFDRLEPLRFIYRRYLEMTPSCLQGFIISLFTEGKRTHDWHNEQRLWSLHTFLFESTSSGQTEILLRRHFRLRIRKYLISLTLCGLQICNLGFYLLNIYFSARKLFILISVEAEIWFYFCVLRGKKKRKSFHNI